MADGQAVRRPSTSGLALVSDARSVALTGVGDLSRFAVRGDRLAADAIGTAFGVELPAQPLRSAAREGRAALWLGPDEWLLLAEARDAETITAAVRTPVGDRPHSWVDISHRNAGFLISGPHAADVLNAGCPLPLDLASFPVGKCTRTLFGKAEIVLWRCGEMSFRIEVWRSFAAYLAELVAEAAREHRVERAG
jgi:sarcosine oxidase, subunit gamma